MAQRDALKAHEKQRQALALALAGLDYQSIADRLGYNSRQAAWKSVQSAMEKAIRPAAEEYKELQLSRLDVMLKSIWPDILKGDLKAIDRALRIEERRSRLLGLDAPLKQELSGPDGEPIKVIKITMGEDDAEAAN